MRAAWVALDLDMKNKMEKLMLEHSLAHPRGILGYNTKKFSSAEKYEAQPVMQALVIKNDISGRKSLYIGSHAKY